jgi:hypothetical protein
MEYTASITPSADFVPLVRLVNPYFVFCYNIGDNVIENFLSWLKVCVHIPKALFLRSFHHAGNSPHP